MTSANTVLNTLTQGIDEFNTQRYYECHETLETLWLETSGPFKLFLQGLIQAAAGLLHFKRGNLKGTQSLLKQSLKKLNAVCQEPCCQQWFDLDKLIQQLEQALAASTQPRACFTQITVPYIGFNKHRIHIYGHRGHLYKHPENTLPSLQAGLTMVDGVELDVIRLQSGEIIIHHDDQLGRLFPSPQPKRLMHQTWQDIAHLSLDQTRCQNAVTELGQEPSMLSFEGSLHIPRLDELLPISAHKTLLIEIKRPHALLPYTDGIEEVLATWVAQHQLEKHVIIISFNPFALKQFHRIAPHLNTGLDVNHSVLNRPMIMRIAKQYLGITHWLPRFTDTTATLIRHTHQLGLTVIPWCNRLSKAQEYNELKRLIPLHPDGLITNQPDVLCELLHVPTGSPTE